MLPKAIDKGWAATQDHALSVGAAVNEKCQFSVPLPKSPSTFSAPETSTAAPWSYYKKNFLAKPVKPDPEL